MTRRVRRCCSIPVIAMLVATGLVLVGPGAAERAAALVPGVLEVDTTVDSAALTACTDAPNDCSLRGATINANADANAEIETILVPAGTYEITIAGNESAGGSFDINYSASIIGAGSGVVTVDANGIDRAFVFNRGSGTLAERIVSLSGMTIREGNACAGNGSGAGGGTQGGAIFIGAHATLDDIVAEGNTTVPCASGGGIALVNGSLTMSDSVVRNNTAQSSGAGVYTSNATTTSITRSTISGNSAPAPGGGMAVQGTVAITDSTISGNSARANGGGIHTGTGGTNACCAAFVTIRNSTISGNIALAWTSGTPQPFPGQGGGIHAQRSQLTIESSTITANIAQNHPVTGGQGSGGAISTAWQTPVTVRDSIIRGNAGLVDCLINAEGSLSTTTSIGCGGANVDPLLGSLADNGGPTRTHLPAEGSPAIDAAAGAPQCPAADQRGVARPQRSGCDIGAVEVAPPPPPPCSDLDWPTFTGASGFTFNGTAGSGAIDGAALRLTTTAFNQASSVFRTAPVQLGADGSFSTVFDASFTSSFAGGADGIAFILQAVGPTALGAYGGGLSYEGIDDSIAIELDTWNNGPAYNDSSNSHVALDVGGTFAGSTVVDLPYDLEAVGTSRVWIDHDGASDLLQVRIAQGTERPHGALLSVPVDLPAVLGGTSAYAGFGSGTGTATARHDILSWAFDGCATPTLDDERTVSIADTSALEASGELTFDVTLSAPSTETITVSAETTDGGTAGSDDFDAISETVTFEPGDTTEQVAVPVSDDDEIEVDETVELELSDPDGAVLDTDDDALGTIVDDDDPCVTWDGGGDGTSWSDPLNWDVDELPGATSSACIPAGAAVVHDAGTDVVAALVVSGEDGDTPAARLRIADGELAVAGATDAAEIEVVGGVLTLGALAAIGLLAIEDGELAGDGDVDIAEGLDWRGGAMSGAGTTTIEPDASLHLVEGDRTLARLLSIEGHASWEAGDVAAGDGSEIVVASGGELELDDADVSSPSITSGGTLDLDGGSDLEIAGHLTLLPSSRVEIELSTGGTGDISSVGELLLDGTLALTTTPPMAPTEGTFEIVAGERRAGSFDTVTGRSIGNGFRYAVSYDPTSVDLTVVPSTDGDLADLEELTGPAWEAILDWLAAFDLDGFDMPAHGLPPFELPVVTDDLADLFDLPDAVDGVSNPFPALEGSDEDVLDALVAAGFDVDWIVGGLGANPEPPTEDDLLQVSRTVSLGALVQAAGFGGDTFNDEHQAVLAGLADALGLDGDLDITGDLAVHLVVGLDVDGPYVGAGTALQLAVDADGGVSGAGDVGGSTAAIDGTGEAALVVELRPASGDRLRLTDLAAEPFALLRPAAAGTASLDLDTTVAPADLTWSADITVTTGLVGATTVDLLATVDGSIGLPGVTEADGTTPAEIDVHGTTDGVTWSLTGSASSLLLQGLTIDDVEVGATIGPDVLEGDGAASLHLDLGASGTTVDVDLTAAFDATSYEVSGHLETGPLTLGTSPAIARLHDVVVDASIAGTIPAGVVTGGVTVAIGTLVVLPEPASPGVVPGGAVTASDVVGTIEGDGAITITAASISAEVAGLLAFTATAATIVIDAESDAPIVAVEEVVATIPQLGDLQVTITDLTLDQDGTFAAASAEVDTAEVAEAIGIAGVLPFDVHGVLIEFAERVGGGYLLDEFTVGVCGSFDETEIASLPFDVSLTVGDGSAGPGCEDVPEPIAFSVAVDSFLDGQIRPLDLGPITLEISNLVVGEVTFGGSLTFDGYVDGVLSPTVGGTFSVSDGPGDLDELELQVLGVFDSPTAPTAIDISGAFVVSGSLSDTVELDGAVLELELGLALDAELDLAVTGPTLTGATFDRVEIALGEYLRLIGTNGELDFAPAPGAPFVSFEDLDVELDDAAGVLAGWEGSAHDFGLSPTFEPVLGPDFGITIDPPDDERFGLPDWLPLAIEQIGIRFRDFDLASIPDGLTWEELSHFVITLSGGLTVTDQWPIAAVVDGLEVDLHNLVTGDGFPITNLEGVEMGVAPFELVEGFRVGGILGLRTIDVDGTDVLYGRLAADFEYEGIGAGIDLVVSEFGPILAKLRVPLGVPLGPTGLILTGVEGGISFGGEAFPDIESPMEILHDPAFDTDFPITDDRIVEQLRLAVAEGVYTWDVGFTLALSGSFVHLAAPGAASGEVTLGLNVGLGADPEVALIGQGDVTIFGMPFVDAAVLLDLDTPTAPRIDLAFEAPAVGNPLGFALPAHQTFELTLDTTGVVAGIALGTRRFLEQLNTGTLGVGAALFDDSLHALGASWDAQRLAANAAGTLPSAAVTLLLDLDGDGQLSVTERARVINRTFVLHRFLGAAGIPAFIPLPASGVPGNLAVAAEAVPAFLTALLEEAGALLSAPNSYTFTGVDPALVALLGPGSAALAAFVDVARDAVGAGTTAFYEVFAPALSVRGAIQPVLFGIPFGEPEQEVELLVTKDGLAFGFDADITGIMENVIKLFDPLGIAQTFLTIMTLGFDTQIGLDVELPIAGIIPMLLGAQAFPSIDPMSSAWGARVRGGIQLLDFATTDLTGLLVPPGNVAFVDAKVQKIWANPSAPLDPLRIPIQQQSHYDALIRHGGLLLTGRLLVPKLTTDPIGLLGALNLQPPSNPLQLPAWIASAAQTLDQLDDPASIQVFIPGFSALMDPNFDDYESEDERAGFHPMPDLLAKVNAILGSAYFEGTFDGTILSLPTIQGSLTATTNGLAVDVGLPGTGLRAGFQLTHRDEVVNGATVPFPRTSSNVTFDSTKVANLLAPIGLPPLVTPFAGASATFRAYSPGYEPTSTDALLRQGGIEIGSRLNIGTIVQNAQFKAKITPTGNALRPFDASATASVASFTPIPGITLTNGTVGFTRNAAGFSGSIGGTFTLPPWLAAVAGASTIGATGSFTSTGAVTLTITVNGLPVSLADLVNPSVSKIADILRYLQLGARQIAENLKTHVTTSIDVITDQLWRLFGSFDQVADALFTKVTTSVNEIARQLRRIGALYEQVVDTLKRKVTSSIDAITDALRFVLATPAQIAAALLAKAGVGFTVIAQQLQRIGQLPGQITTLLLALPGITYEQLGAALKAIGGTFQTITDNIDDLTSATFDQIALALKGAQATANQIADAIDDFTAATFSELGAALAATGASLQQITDAVDDVTAATVNEIAGALRAAGATYQQVTDNLDDFTTATFAQIGTALRSVAATYAQVTDLLDDLTAATFAEIGSALGAAGATYEQITNNIDDLTTATVTEIGGALRSAGASYDEITNHLDDFTSASFEQIGSALRTAGATFQQITDRLDDLTSASFAQIGSSLDAAGASLQQITDNIDDFTAATVDDIGRALDAAGASYEQITNNLDDFTSASFEQIGSALDVAGASLDVITDNLDDFTSASFDAIASSLEGVGASFHQVTDRLDRKTAATLSQMGTALRSIGASFTQVTDALDDETSATMTQIAQLIKDLGAGVSTVISAIVTVFQASYTTVFNLMVTIGFAVTDILAVICNFFTTC